MVALTPKAFDILLILVRNRGRVVEKDELMRLVWPGTVVEENNLTRNISSLRKALGEGPNDHRFIVTVPGRGYQFAAVIPLAMPLPDGAVEASDHLQATKTEESESSVVSPSVLHTGILAGGRRTGGLGLYFAIAACVLVSASAWLYLSRHSQAALPPPRVIPVVALQDIAECASISPDGNYVAFERHSESPGLAGIYLKQVDSERYLQLTRVARDACPAWSPDGRWIAFSRFAGTERTIYLMSALGGPERRVYSSGPVLPIVDWSPDGKFLALSSPDTTPGTYSISLLNLETLETHKLTVPPAGEQDGAPAYSPDGRRLAFIRTNGALTSSEIYVVDVSGGTPRRLTSEGWIASPPVWTRNGQSILYSSARAGLPTLWRISTAGGTPEQVTVPGIKAFRPTLSASGRRLAYQLETCSSTICSFDLTKRGSAAGNRDVLSSKGLNEWAEISPGGNKIVLVSDRSGSQEIYISAADGSNLLQLTHFGVAHAPESPRWSPDGQQIVFDAVDQGHTTIFALQADGGTPRRLSDSPTDHVNPTWSRNGQWLYFASSRSGQWQIWKMPSSGGAAVQLTHQGGFVGYESADGKHLYCAKTASEPDIWVLNLEDGTEGPVSPSVHLDQSTAWSLTDHGILFIQKSSGSHAGLRYLDLAKGRISDLTVLPEQFWRAWVSSSRNGRIALYERIDSRTSNVVVVDNFR